MAREDVSRDVAEFLQRRFFGKYRGIVKENEDETGRGRLQVIVPAVMGDQPVWAMPCVPYAGNGVGFFALPAKETGVWVEFEAGDPSFPIWVGCFWADGQIPDNDAVPTVKFIRTEKLTIRIDDEEGAIEIETAGGASLRMTGTDIVQKATRVTRESRNGKKTVLDSTGLDVHDGAFSVT